MRHPSESQKIEEQKRELSLDADADEEAHPMSPKCEASESTKRKTGSFVRSDRSASLVLPETQQEAQREFAIAKRE